MLPQMLHERSLDLTPAKLILEAEGFAGPGICNGIYTQKHLRPVQFHSMLCRNDVPRQAVVHINAQDQDSIPSHE